MSGRVRMTAVSAVAASLGLTGAVLLATAPMTAPRANAAQVAVADPTQIEPDDATIIDDPGVGPDPTVTVTITESPDPVVTQTKTVTPKTTKPPKVTKTPKPTASKTTPIVPPATTGTPPASLPLITNTASAVPSTPPSVEPTASDPQVSLALVTPPTSETPTPSPSFEEPTPDSVPIEIRNASPEYDQLTMSKKLAIPGVLLAVLVMLGVLIFEGRVRRMAHAAAVRKAGPRLPGRHRGDDFTGGYPMAGYPVYHGGTAYAPIISFVPVQGYPNVQRQIPTPPYDPQGFTAGYEQGLGGQIGLPGPVPAGQPPAGADQVTLQGPLPALPDKPRRGLFGKLRRGGS